MKCRDCRNYEKEWCEKVVDSPHPDIERDCRHFVRATNGDRIRAMTDEELGNWLCSIMADCDEKCPGRNWCKTGHKGTIAWLKQPVEED